MKGRRILLFAVPMAALLLPQLDAQVNRLPTGYQNPFNASSAVDANGVRHRAQDYGGRPPPWIDDQTKALAPEYPFEARRLRHEGSGLFRLTLDLRSGVVVNITVLRSTGFNELDASAVSAFRKWRWKPGKWKQIDKSIIFKLEPVPAPPPRGAARLPQPY